MKERRVKVLWLAEDALPRLLNWFHRESLALPVLDGLPAGYRVEAAVHDWSRRAFGLLVSHDSFDPVPDGGEAPSLPGPDTWHQVYLEKRRDLPPTYGLADEPAVVKGVL